MHSTTFITIFMAFTGIGLVASAPSATVDEHKEWRCNICKEVTQANMGLAKGIADSTWKQWPGATSAIMANTLDQWCKDKKNLKSDEERKICDEIVKADATGSKYLISNALLAGANGADACHKGGVC